MSEDERAAFLRAYDGPSPEDWEKNPEEAYWRSFRQSIELIRMLRDLHPTARQLAMTPEEITSYYRRLKPGPRTEEQRQFDLKIVSRERPGKKANPNEKQDDKYLPLMRECINRHSPNMSRARAKFTQQALIQKLCASRKTAQNHWYRLWPAFKRNLPGN
jgi:hypothetical protein